jgi:peptide deformylase
MAVIPVRHLPDPVLREKTRRVTSITPAVHKLVEDMIETMHAERGVGIAANQVGSLLRIAYIEIPKEVDEETGVETGGEQYVLVNPEIIRRVGERTVQEGCLSVPGFRGELVRSQRVVAKALDLQGREYRIKADGLLAQALEHETDHLNGIVYIDRMERIEDLWTLVPAGEQPDERDAGPSPEAVWRMRRPAPPVVRRG